MQITFDPQKDLKNQAKHGVSLKTAEHLEWDKELAIVDSRHDYGEIRWIGFAPMGGRVYCVVYTERNGDKLRVISLRRANRREVQDYESRIYFAN